MENFLSPSVNITNIDFTQTTVAVATRSAAFVGNFEYGPCNEVIQVANSRDLVSIFGRPTDTNYVDLLSAENFLTYSGSLFVVRADAAAAQNARDASFADPELNVSNRDSFDTQALSGFFFAARYKGDYGNSIFVSVADTTSFDAWPYKNQFTAAPDAGEVHVIVVDSTGAITGVKGTVLERYPFASTTSGTRNLDGTNVYVKSWVNEMSRYIYSIDTPVAGDYQLEGGVSAAPTDGERNTAWDLFANTEDTDTPIMFTGGAGVVVDTYVKSLAENRNDTIACFSPDLADVLNANNRLENVLTYRTAIGSSSFGVMDNNWKYFYDRYNDVFRWIPCNSDVAGLMSSTTEAWESPAGLNRGQIRNAVKLAWNPTKIERDELYRNGINPIVKFQSDGIVLFGDRTLLSRPSAFGSVNVRRLFNFVNRTVCRTSRFFLFEFNDEITRQNYENTLRPILEDIQGKRGITAFEIICDDTNNPDDIVDQQILVCTIRLQPTRSINFIDVTIRAERTGEVQVNLGQ